MRTEKTYTVFWRFKGKNYDMVPLNATAVKACTKKEVIEIFKNKPEIGRIKIVWIGLD